jgi:hypothetical protein
MSRNALFVAIDDYGKFGALASPESEAAQWRDVLTHGYGFNVDLLTGAAATRDAVEQAFVNLLSAAGSGDQIVFGFCGHGMVIDVRDESGKPTGDLEEALVCYPGTAAALEPAALSDNDLAEAVKRAALPDGVAFTVIADCCFSGRLQIDGNNGGNGNGHGNGSNGSVAKPTILSLTHRSNGRKAVHGTQSQSVNRFGSFGRAQQMESGLGVPVPQQPLILAAAAPDGLAFEASISGVPHLRFSNAALTELKAHMSDNYASLVSAVNKVFTANKLPQSAKIVGDTLRQGNSVWN